MAALDNALTTLARYKSFAEITNSSRDTLLTILIASVSKFVETYCGRRFKRQTFTNEVYDGKNHEKLLLKNYPVISGQSFTIQRRTSLLNEASWETIPSEEYFVDNEKGIVTFTYKLSEVPQGYRVTYTAGFYLPAESTYQDGTDDHLDLPYELELAVMDMVSHEDRRRKNKGVTSSQVGDVSVTYGKMLENSPEIKQTLQAYRRPRYF